jgi:Mycothiol maleylpyruvate isomerase N-terminal domain
MSDTMKHTRQQVIARTRREFAELDRLVARLRPADWTRRVPRPPTRDAWTVKDALAHIVYWKEHTARVIRGERRLPEMRGLDVEQINRLIYRRWHGHPPAEVLGWHRRVHADVLRTLARTPDAWFGRRERSPQWPADFDGHSTAHRVKDIAAVLGGVATRSVRASQARRLVEPAAASRRKG